MFRLGFGLSQGYATLGAICWDARSDYDRDRDRHRARRTPLRGGCAGEILISPRLCAAVEA
jgi:hypothetical protein